jgi:hypothetical protein
MLELDPLPTVKDDFHGNPGTCESRYAEKSNLPHFSQVMVNSFVYPCFVHRVEAEVFSVTYFDDGRVDYTTVEKIYCILSHNIYIKLMS